ncbi:uncharacterized protein LOC132260380 [Phlebotomus argentipes]|uniref:uncharacterized protein LOC132260380 n=1 Tax=Phlebotomus argentipes TaxID=94469 RepID=UPI002893064C|nr:uncharacterized protein LOC132260380 [Phlebotomus argentipes]
MDRLVKLNKALSSETFGLNQCICEDQDKKRSKKKEKILLLYSRHALELKTRQKRLDEKNERFLSILLKTRARVDDQTIEKIPDRRPPKKTEKQLYPNYLKPEDSISINRCRRKIYLEFSPDAKSEQTYGRLSVILLFDLAPETCKVFVEYITRVTFQHALPVTRIYTERCLEWLIVDPVLGNRLDHYQIPVNHDYAGTLSALYICSKFSRGSYISFAITFNPVPQFDGRRQVFGYVVKGAELLQYLESLGTSRGYKREDLYLNRCGVDF